METFFAEYGGFLVYFRYACLGILFLWSFYQAFVNESITRRILFAMLTFTTVMFMVLVSDSPANPWRNLFYINLALLCLYNFSKEVKTQRFVDAFKTANAMREKLVNMTHPGNHTPVISTTKNRDII